jgi:hypothetical protein
MAIALKRGPAGDLQQFQVGDSLQVDSIERLNSSGNLVIGSALGSDELQLGSVSGITRVMNDLFVDGEIFPRYEVVQFMLTEDVNNTVQWFTTARGHGGDSPNNKRSGTTVGITNANTCSPYQVPWDATVVRAVMSLKGAGVQSGSVSYPVTYQTQLFSEGFTSESSIGNVYFTDIASGVGTYSVGNTNYKGAANLSINVSEGDLLALKFINGNSASIVGQTRNAFVTLILKER